MNNVFFRFSFKDIDGSFQIQWKNIQIALLALFSLLSWSAVNAEAGDESWSKQFSLPGLNGQVNVLLEDSSGNIYVGGSFTHANGLSVNNIAMWDGISWTALSGGVVGGSVNALAHDGTNLYVGGSFFQVGAPGFEVWADSIALWDGSNWSALGSGADLSSGRVDALEYINGELFVGGAFLEADGVTGADNLAKWDGNGWSALGAGLNGSVGVLTSNNGELYAAGRFSDAGGIADADNLAKWTGSSWSALGSGLGLGVQDYIYSLLHDGSNLYVGGKFDNAGGVTGANNIVKWGSNSWAALDSGVDSSVHSLSSFGSDLYVGGGFNGAGGLTAVNGIAKWDGTNWSVLGSGVGITDFGSVSALVHNGSELYVGGNFLDAGGEVTTKAIAKWNGSNWSGLGSPIPLNGIDFKGLNGSVEVIVSSNTNGWFVGGNFLNAGGLAAADYLAHWDGINWTAVGPGLDGPVNTIAVNGGDIYVAGEFTSAGGAVLVDGIGKWDGNSWSAMNTGLEISSLALVNALQHDGTYLYAGGFFGITGSSAGFTGVVKWDGSNWSPVGSSVPGFAYALAHDGSFLYAGISNGVLRWDGGSGWSQLGSSLNGNVRNMTLDGSTLYIAGNFSNAGGAENADRLAKWNGSDWSAIGAFPVDEFSTVESIEYEQGNLYVGGDEFLSAGTVTNPLLKWNGESWSALGSGLGSLLVSALEHNDNGLLVGGYIYEAGQEVSNHVAHWRAPVITSPAIGSILDGIDQNFNWSASGADITEWSFEIRSSASNLLHYAIAGLGPNNLNTMATGLPDDGSALTAILHYRLQGESAWFSTEASYISAGGIIPPVITTPSAATTLDGGTANFQWSAASPNATSYRLWVGSSEGGDEYGRYSSNSTSRSVSGMPVDGSTIYVTLKWFNGGWNTAATISYTAATLALPEIQSPLAGSTLSGSSETFSWSTIAEATQYRLWLGSQPGSDEYGRFGTAGSSRTVYGLPEDGSTVFATLKWYDGNWHTAAPINYTASTAPVNAMLLSPAAGSTFASSTQYFDWSAAGGASQYRLWVGSTLGGDEHGRYGSTGISKTISGLPVDGSVLYVTLKWYESSWRTAASVEFTAATAVPAFSSPLPGSVISGGASTFTWPPQAGANQYRVWVGSSPGASDYGRYGSVSTSRSVSGLPTDGSTIYVTLKWYDTIWHTEQAVSYSTAP